MTTRATNGRSGNLMAKYNRNRAETTPELDRLRGWERFVIWRWDADKKVAISPRTGRYHGESDPAIWMDYETARREKLRRQSAAGIGFALDETPFCLVDLDRCIRDGEASDFATRTLGKLRGVEEVSASGKGYHSLIRAEKPGGECVSKPRGREIEIYDRARFMAIADESIVDQPVPERQTELEAVYFETFAQGSLEDVAATTKTTDAPDRVPDAELLEKARNCRATGAAFRQLYDHGSTKDYKTRSEAHYALARLLAFWTGKDADRVERLFWGSALADTVERGKPESYVRHTVERACHRQSRTYEPGISFSAKAKVKARADAYLKHVASLEWNLSDTDRAVLIQAVKHAGEWAYLTDDSDLTFNVAQQVLADATGVSQRSVSQSLRHLRDAGYLVRLSRGSTGRNSEYRIPNLGGK